MGSKGHTSSIGSALPEALIKIYKLFQDGKYDESCDAQHDLLEVLNSMPKGLKNDNFLGAADEKYILSIRGKYNKYTTSYYRDANENEKLQLIKILKESNIIPSFEL